MSFARRIADGAMIVVREQKCLNNLSTATPGSYAGGSNKMDIDAALKKAAAMADAISSKEGNAPMKPGAGLPQGETPEGGLDIKALVAKLKSKPVYSKMSDEALEKAVAQMRSKLKGKTVDEAFDALVMGDLASIFMDIAAEEEDEEKKGETAPPPQATETSKEAVKELMGGK